MKNLFGSLPASVRQTIIAMIPLLVVIILFVSVGNFGVSKLNEIRAKIKAAQTDVATLNQKLGILQTLSGTVATGVNPATFALPDTNPSLSVIAQLKNLGVTNGVAITAMKSNAGPVVSGLSETDVSFTVTGTRAQVLDFLSGTAKFAPITLIDKIKIVESAGAVRADVSTKSYSAPLPQTIPSVTQSITDLTASEKQTLVQIGGLIPPTFNQVIPQQGGVNVSPFGQ